MLWGLWLVWHSLFWNQIYKQMRYLPYIYTGIHIYEVHDLKQNTVLEACRNVLLCLPLWLLQMWQRRSLHKGLWVCYRSNSDVYSYLHEFHMKSSWSLKCMKDWSLHLKRCSAQAEDQAFWHQNSVGHCKGLILQKMNPKLLQTSIIPESTRVTWFHSATASIVAAN